MKSITVAALALITRTSRHLSQALAMRARRYIVPLALPAMALAACGEAPNAVPGVVPVATVTLSPTPLALAAGEARSMAAVIRDVDGRVLSGRSLQWSSTNEAVARVSLHGVVSAIAAGTARIDAVAEGKVGSAAVTVLAGAPGEVATVTLDVVTANVDEGATRQLVATPRDANGTPVSGVTARWSSSDLTRVLVSNTGMVTAVRPGSASITVVANGASASATITVVASYPYKLIYAAYENTAMEIFEMDIREAASAPTRVLPAGTWAGNPRPSPDGTRIAFNGQIDGVPGLYVMNRDGSNIVRLIGNENGPAINPTWSPDGTQIAFEIIDRHADIWLMSATTGGNRVNLTAALGSTDQRTPSWSPTLPDGSSRIAFVHRENGVERIHTMRPDGTDRRQVTTGVLDQQPAWSPDGGTIAYIRSTSTMNADLWLVRRTGGDERALLVDGYELAGAQMNPVFSPDGRMIAFGSQHETWGQNGSTQIFTVWLDGTRLARRTTTGGYMPAWIAR